MTASSARRVLPPVLHLARAGRAAFEMPGEMRLPRLDPSCGLYVSRDLAAQASLPQSGVAQPTERLGSPGSVQSTDIRDLPYTCNLTKQADQLRRSGFQRVLLFDLSPPSNPHLAAKVRMLA